MTAQQIHSAPSSHALANTSLWEIRSGQRGVLRARNRTRATVRTAVLPEAVPGSRYPRPFETFRVWGYIEGNESTLIAINDLGP